MLRRFALLAGIVIAGSWIGAGPAAAGGPTSALLVAPQTGMTAGLYYTQPEYDKLSELVRGTPSADTGQTDHYRGPGVRITWLIHDVTVWRVDEVYLEADGGPWIATREYGDTGALPDKPVWHRSTDAAALVKLLGAYKLVDPEAVPSVVADLPLTPAAAPAAPAAPPPAPAAASSWVALSGWRWIVPGLLLGAVVAWGAGRWQRRTGSSGSSGEPRWELIDETPRT